MALVGFMGAGKSAVGRRLAVALALPFVDTDDLIVATAGPIPGIFADRGESGFRALEAEVVVAAIAEAREHPCVLALGGGAVLSGEVRSALRSLEHVVWLDAPAAVLWSRVAAGGAEERPLAADEGTFSKLLEARETLYRDVETQVVQTGDKSAAAAAAEIAERLAAVPAEDRRR